MLDHLPELRNHLQRLGNVLPSLDKPRAAAAGARCWSRHEHPLARQMVRERLARRPLARSAANSPSVAKASSSSSVSSSFPAALRYALNEGHNDHSSAFRASGERSAHGRRNAGRERWQVRPCVASNAVCSASMSSGSFSGPSPMHRWIHKSRNLARAFAISRDYYATYRALCGHQLCCGLR